MWGKGADFWRFKNSQCIPGVHVTRTLLCGFFEVLCPWTEFLNSSHCGLSRQPLSLCHVCFHQEKREHKIIKYLNIHMRFGFRGAALAWRHVCLCCFSKIASDPAVMSHRIMTAKRSRQREGTSDVWELLEAPMILELLLQKNLADPEQFILASMIT